MHGVETRRFREVFLAHEHAAESFAAGRQDAAIGIRLELDPVPAAASCSEKLRDQDSVAMRTRCSADAGGSSRTEIGSLASTSATPHAAQRDTLCTYSSPHSGQCFGGSAMLFSEAPSIREDGLRVA
jgi:hypothetical protein